jgi:thiamine pyrophosphokinase
MGERVALVLAGGDPVDPATAPPLPEGALVIAADSGVDQAARLGWRVDMAVGDFDSVDAAHLAAASAAGAKLERHRPDKDATDLALALDAAMAAGADRVIVVGGHGGRLDHQLANLLLLASPAYATAATDAYMGSARLHVVHAGRPRRVKGDPGELVTLAAVGGPAEGIWTTGLAWALTNDTFQPGESRGVSNVLVEHEAEVRLTRGTLLAILPGLLADPGAMPPGGGRDQRGRSTGAEGHPASP